MMRDDNHDPTLEARFGAFVDHDTFDAPPVQAVVASVDGRMNSQRVALAALGAAAVLLVGLGFILGRPVGTNTSIGATPNTGYDTSVTRAPGDDGTIFDCSALTFGQLAPRVSTVVIGEVGPILSTDVRPASEFSGTRQEVEDRSFTPFSFVVGDATSGVDRIEHFREIPVNAKGERKIRECPFAQPAVVEGDVVLGVGSQREHAVSGHALFRIELPDGTRPTREQLDDPTLLAVPIGPNTGCDHPVDLAALVLAIQSSRPSPDDTRPTGRPTTNIYCP